MNHDFFSGALWRKLYWNVELNIRIDSLGGFNTIMNILVTYSVCTFVVMYPTSPSESPPRHLSALVPSHRSSVVPCFPKFNLTADLTLIKAQTKGLFSTASPVSKCPVSDLFSIFVIFTFPSNKLATIAKAINGITAMKLHTTPQLARSRNAA